MYYCSANGSHVPTSYSVCLGDGTKRIFNAGDVLLADDLTGRGHTTAVYGDAPRVSVAIPIVG